jgi:hypothetical protein
VSGPSRRAVLLAAGGAVVVGAAGIGWALDRPGPPRAVVPAGPRPGGTTPEDVRAEALRSVGVRLAQGAWRDHAPGPTGPWSAVFASWLLRGLGVPAASTPADLYAPFAATGRTGTSPQVGALVFYTYDAPGSVHHVGFVESVRGGAVGTVEGDVPGGLAPEHTFVRRFGVPWDTRVGYAYPDYAGVTSSS